MKSKTFMGGVNPRENKESTIDSPINIILSGNELIFPLLQHNGTSSKAIVEVGDKVLAGQKIAKAEGFYSVPLHTSVSGTVTHIEPRRVSAGEMIMSIVISNDGLYDEFIYPEAPPLDDMEPADIISRIQDAGIVGMGGAGYPTHIKLSPANPEKISHVIINAAESEPYLTKDHRLLIDDTDRLLNGVKILLKLFPYARGIIAITENKTESISLLKERTNKDRRVGVKTLKPKYPQGSERQIIMAVTGRTLDSRTLPQDIGVILLNAETVINIFMAVANNKNSTTRIITASGDALSNPQNFNVRLGTIFSDIIEQAGGFLKEPAKIISGGPMMGHAIIDKYIPITKMTSAILCFTKDEVALAAKTACIHCGKCAGVCPEQLIPVKLAYFAEHDDKESFHKYQGEECIECGCCTYICPAKISLKQMIVTAKNK